MLVGTGGSLGNVMNRAQGGSRGLIAGVCGLRAALACAVVIALIGCGGGSASPRDAALGGAGDGGGVGSGGGIGSGGDICIGGNGGGAVGGNGIGGGVGVGGSGIGGTGVGGTGMGGASVGGSGMGGICDGGMGGSVCADYTPPGPPVGLSVDFVAGVNVSTLAGSGVPGAADGTGAGVGLSNPVSIALASNGDLFVAEYDGNRIRRITPAGVSTTVMPIGTLNQPFGLGAASDSVLYVETDHNPQGAKTLTSGTIWRVDVASQAATVVKADIGRPRGVAVLLDGRIALSDYRSHRLMLLDPQTSVATPLAGNGCAGYADGQGAAAQFDAPYGIAVRSDGSLVVADYGNNRLRTVKVDGTVGTLAGDGINGMVDGAAMQARFFAPEDVAIDASGAIYVSDTGNHRVRRLAQGQVQTLAGDGVEGFADGAGNMAEFYGQEGIAVTPDGRTVYVADGTSGADGVVPYHRVRAIAVPAATH